MLSQKNNFCSKLVTVANADIANRTVQNIQKFFKTIFDKDLTPFCKTILWLKQLYNGIIV